MEQNGTQNSFQLALLQRTIQAEHPVYIASRPAHGLSQEFLVQADEQFGNNFDTSNAISTGEDLGVDFGGNAATAGTISVNVCGSDAERSARHGCQAERAEHWKLRQIHDHQS